MHLGLGKHDVDYHIGHFSRRSDIEIHRFNICQLKWLNEKVVKGINSRCCRGFAEHMFCKDGFVVNEPDFIFMYCDFMREDSHQVP